jgi:SAM-dependent methyltransferase
MYNPDVVTLRQFYATPFGEGVRNLISAALQQHWPEIKNEAMMCIGFATPYLDTYIAGTSSVAVAMPAGQGAAYWPSSGDNRVFLSHESELPIKDESLNRILLIHSVENSEQLAGMIKEIYRVLTPGGRVLAVVPNRLGLWSRSSRSPFGYGRPFSAMQLREWCSDNDLTVIRSSSAVFVPPTHIRLIWKFASKIELLGKMFTPFFGGVLLIEAEKQIYASVRQPVIVRKSYASRPDSKPVLGKMQDFQ